MRNPDWATEDGRVKLYLGDCRKVLPELGDIDAVVTDPPYPKEFIPLYSPTWEACDACLRSGGMVFAMCGQAFLPDVVASFPISWQYVWTGCFDCSHMATSIWPRGISAAWKPLFIYGKPPVRSFKHWKYDTISLGKSGYKAPKQWHEWGQGAYEFETVITRFDVGDVVLDPFMGSGTTGIAAIRCGRQFVGVELSDEHFATAVKRIKSELERAPLFEKKPTYVTKQLFGTEPNE